MLEINILGRKNLLCLVDLDVTAPHSLPLSPTLPFTPTHSAFALVLPFSDAYSKKVLPPVNSFTLPSTCVQTGLCSISGI
mmetsp:Transcript_18594/g.42508  ORF Transcript_18594/g.42508 Transcript_18594/m.42508 type:complete len:80 (+) Transcript_18594:94-333(+)